MNVDLKVPFYSNTPDDTHCFQAALRMILGYFHPKEEYSWKELDSLSAKGKDLWTWPTAALIWLKEKGLDVKVISPFEYDSFIQEGGDFLIRKYGNEVGHAQIQHSDIPQEREFAKKLLRSIMIVNEIPDLKKIVVLLQQNYLVMCNVNSQILNKKNGYTGHFVVVKGFTDEEFILHDPGLPPMKNRRVHFRDFEKAWSYPNEEARDLYAFKR